MEQLPYYTIVPGEVAPCLSHMVTCLHNFDLVSGFGLRRQSNSGKTTVDNILSCIAFIFTSLYWLAQCFILHRKNLLTNVHVIITENSFHLPNPCGTIKAKSIHVEGFFFNFASVMGT